MSESSRDADEVASAWRAWGEDEKAPRKAIGCDDTRPMRIRWHHEFLQPPSGEACIAPTRSAVARQIEKVMPALRGNVRPDALMFLRTGTPGELQVNVHGFGMFGIVSR